MIFSFPLILQSYYLHIFYLYYIQLYYMIITNKKNFKSSSIVEIMKVFPTF